MSWEIIAKDAVIRITSLGEEAVSLTFCWTIYFSILGILATVISIAATLNQEIRLNLISNYLIFGSKKRFLYLLSIPVFFLLSLIDSMGIRLILLVIIFFTTFFILIRIPSIFDREKYYEYSLRQLENEFRKTRIND